MVHAPRSIASPYPSIGTSSYFNKLNEFSSGRIDTLCARTVPNTVQLPPGDHNDIKHTSDTSHPFNFNMGKLLTKNEKSEVSHKTYRVRTAQNCPALPLDRHLLVLQQAERVLLGTHRHFARELSQTHIRHIASLRFFNMDKLLTKNEIPEASH